MHKEIMPKKGRKDLHPERNGENSLQAEGGRSKTSKASPCTIKDGEKVKRAAGATLKFEGGGERQQQYRD